MFLRRVAVSGNKAGERLRFCRRFPGAGPRAVLYASLVCAFVAAPAVWAQKVTEGKGEFAEYYDKPHEQQMKSHISGAKAVPLDPQNLTRFLITDAKWETFRVTGEGELVVQAPEAIFDRTQHSISSAGPIHVKTADGSFSIDGEGFLWLQETSVLFISNRVHTIVLPDLASKEAARGQNQSAPPSSPQTTTNRVEVFSREFEFQADSGE